MMENIMALALAPLGVFAKRKFLRPMTKGLMGRSARLLDISSLPSRRYRSKYFVFNACFFSGS